ncbi:MAG: PKD domain-containing protein [Flavobacteriaceae bacterium]
MKTKSIVLSLLIVCLMACSKSDEPKSPDTDPISQPEPDPISEPEPENDAPTALAGDDRKVEIGSLVKLDASASTDPDGDDLTYKWSFVKKPASSEAIIIGVQKDIAEFTLDKAGEYELELKVSDGDIEVSDNITISNKAPKIDEIDAWARSFPTEPDEIFGTRPGGMWLIGDFLSPNREENIVTLSGKRLEIDELEIDFDGGTQDYMSFRIPEDAVSGELKLKVGEEEVVSTKVVKILSEPVDEFAKANPDLEIRKRSWQNGYDPKSYFEIGTRFKPLVKGKVVAFKLTHFVNQVHSVTLWDIDEKLPIQTVNFSVTQNSTYFVDLLNPISLEKDKEYVLSFNSNDWYLHIDEQDSQKNHFPQIINDFEFLGTAFRAGTDTIFPEEGFPNNYIVRGPDIVFVADPK